MSLEALELSFSHSGKEILNRVSFALKPGQLVAVAGPNGVGKTTLLRLLLGLISPSSGQVRLMGRPLPQLSRRETAKLAAYVPQSLPRLFPLSVFEFVLLGRRPHLDWRPSGKDSLIAAKSLSRLGLAALAKHDFARLSGGQAQKVMIARALAQETPIVLLDEPTASLDLRNQLEVMELLRSLTRESGVSVLASLHDVNLALRYADKVLLLSKGQAYGFGTPDEVINIKSLNDVYQVEAGCLQGDGVRQYVALKPSTEQGEEDAFARG